MTEDTLAGRLKLAREKSGLSQSKLARIVGISPQAIQSLESGNSAGSKYLAEIAGAIGVEATWLATGEGDMLRRPRRDISEPSSSDPAENLEFFMSVVEGEENAFPPVRVAYNADTIPVFVCEDLNDARIPRKSKIDLQNIIMKWIIDSNHSIEIPKEIIGYLCVHNVFYVTGKTPDDYTPRPHYLFGQVEAYAIYINSLSNISTININHTIAFVSPHKRPDYGDIVIAWHKSNTFIIGRLQSESPDSISLEHKDLTDRMINEKDFDKAMEMPTAFFINKDQIKSIHTVMGLEFSAPRTTKVRTKPTIRPFEN
jgi:transcriptional regulator with XRE-family HTH domain